MAPSKTDRQPPDRFENLLRSLVSILGSQEAPYAVIGGTGVLVWGNPVTTQDIDIIVTVRRRASKDVLGAFFSAGYVPALGKSREDAGNAFSNGWIVRLFHPNGLWVDAFRAVDAADKGIVTAARSACLLGVEFRVAAPEDIIAHKLVRFEDKDRVGIRSILVVSARSMAWSAVRNRAEQLARAYGEGVLAHLGEVEAWYDSAREGTLRL